MDPAHESPESPDKYRQCPEERTALLYKEKAAQQGNGRLPAVTPSRCKMPVSPYPVYAVVALFMFLMTAVRICTSNTIYNKVCLNTFHNLTLCCKTSFTRHHILLQDEAAKWTNYMALTQLLPAILSNLLLSSYCDQAGHKLPLILPAVGSLLACSWLAVLTNPRFLHWPMESLLLFGFLDTFLGSSPMILMSGFGYVTKAVRPENRYFHFALTEGSLLIGILAGNLLNGPIIDNFGLDVMVYICVAACGLVVFIVCFFFVDIRQPSSNFSWKETLRMKYAFDFLKCVFKRRPGHSRMILQLCFVTYTVVYICVLGYHSLGFLYFVKEVGLTLTQYSIYSGVVLALQAAVSPFLMLLAKKLGMDLMTAGQIAAVLLAVGFTVMSLGKSLVLIWIGGMFLTVQTVVFAVARNAQTKLVEKDELGKLFSYDALVQAIMKTAAIFSFNSLYAWSLPFWPQLFIALGALLSVICLIILSIIILLQRHDRSSAAT